ncbi:MAG TPA: glycosyltransferase [Gammaproteobacteria bacterium]|nr:glycosyltransferase [Gammaproteobacteria bacterium]
MTAKPQRARVLVLTSTYPRHPGDGMVPPFVHELSRRLTPWFEMHVLAPHAPGAAVTAEMDGVQVHRFRYLPERLETLAYGGGILPGLRRRPWRAAGLVPFIAAEYLAARRLLRSRDFSLVHAHWLVPHGVIAARLRRPRRALLATSHGSDLFALEQPWLRPLKRYALRNADAVSVVSAALRGRAASLMEDSGKIHVLPMGVDTTRFQPPAPNSARQGLLFVGRLVEGKGVSTLLQALELLQAQGLRPTLTLVGSGPAEAGLRSRVTRAGLGDRVTFLGPLPNGELPAHYQRAAALVFPSLLGKQGQQEGMGLVPLEALACGCPVIASALPAVTEVISHEETGLLFPPGDVQALAACAAAVLSAPEKYQAWASSGRDRIMTTHSWENTAEGYRDLYTRLIESAHQA